jgi:hypothetical protein
VTTRSSGDGVIGFTADVRKWPSPALLLAPLVFLIHDLEETLRIETMNERAREVSRRLPPPFARQAGKLHYTRRGMGGAAAALFAAQIGLTLWSSHSRRGERFLTLALVGRLLNGATHIGETVVLRRYVPGVATSPAVMAAACLALRSLMRERSSP